MEANQDMDPLGAVPTWFARRLAKCEAMYLWRYFLLSSPCCYCGEDAETIEHVRPVSKGGTNDYENLVGACADCNSSRSSTPFLVWMLLNGKSPVKIRRMRKRASDKVDRRRYAHMWGWPKRTPKV